MKCRHCQTEIADKALICYRCGRATTELRIAPPASASLFERRRRPRWPIVVAAVILVIVMLALWFISAGQIDLTDLQRTVPEVAASIIGGVMLERVNTS